MSDAESVSPPKSKKSFGQRKRRGSKGQAQPLRIKIEHLHLLVSQLPNDQRDAVAEAIRTASLREKDKTTALRAFDEPNFVLSSGPTIEIEPIVASMGDIEIEELIAVAEGRGPSRNRQQVKASNKMKAALARERGRRNLKKKQATDDSTERSNPGTSSSSEYTSY